MDFRKLFEWIISPNQSTVKSLDGFHLQTLIEDVNWARSQGREKTKAFLIESRQVTDIQAEILARQITEEVTLKLDAYGTGKVCLGHTTGEPRYIYFFREGRSTNLCKVILPFIKTPGASSKDNGLVKRAKVLLVNVNSPDYPVITAPLGIITLGGHLKRTFLHQVEVEYIDMQLEERIAIVEQNINEMKPDIVGLSVKVGGTQAMIDLLKMLTTTQFRKQPLIILGNIVPTYASSEIHHMFPQAVCCIGRGELTLENLVKHVASAADKTALTNVPSCSFVVGNVIYEIEGIPFDLQYLGVPDWETLFQRYRPNQYQEIWIEASRGCPQKRGGVGCSFCAIMPSAGMRDWRARVPDNVLTEIKLLANLGVKHVRFADEEFMAGQTISALHFAQQLRSLRKELHINGITMPTFDFAVRVDDIIKRGIRDNKPQPQVINGEARLISNNQIRKLTLQTFKEAGLIQVYLGLESGSFNQLKRMYKGTKPRDNEDAIAVLREIGIQVAGGWIMLDPLMEGVDELRENIDFIERNRLIPKRVGDDFITGSITRMRALEGSPLVEQLRKKGLLGARKPNLIEYEFKYINKVIAEIADILEQWENDKSLVYAVKNQVALGVLERRSNQETERIAKYLFEVKALDFAFIKSLVKTAEAVTEADSLRHEFKHIYEEFSRRRRDVLGSLVADIESGVIRDDAGTLRMAVKKQGSFSRHPIEKDG